MPRSRFGFNKQLIAKLILLLLMMTGAARLAQATELEPLLETLQQEAVSVESLYSPFVQQKHLAIFDESLESRGVFAYRRPDFLRWELLTPVNSGFVIRGDKGERWNRLSGERDDFIISSDPVMGLISRQLLAWARFDIAWLKTRYQLELLAEQPLSLKLTPKDAGEATFIRDIQIDFAADRSHVRQLQLNEQEGDWTRLEFTAMEKNSPLDDSIFQVPEL